MWPDWTLILPHITSIYLPIFSRQPFFPSALYRRCRPTYTALMTKNCTSRSPLRPGRWRFPTYPTFVSLYFCAGRFPIPVSVISVAVWARPNWRTRAPLDRLPTPKNSYTTGPQIRDASSFCHPHFVQTTWTNNVAPSVTRQSNGCIHTSDNCGLISVFSTGRNVPIVICICAATILWNAYYASFSSLSINTTYPSPSVPTYQPIPTPSSSLSSSSSTPLLFYLLGPCLYIGYANRCFFFRRFFISVQAQPLVRPRLHVTNSVFL